jgi:nitrogen fixation protein NifU and related proteins
MDLEAAREFLIAKSRSKKNGFFPQSVTHEFPITNPLCGDHVHIKINLHEKQIVEIGFSARACAICSASTSVMCEEVGGKAAEEALAMATQFENILLTPGTEIWPQTLGSLIGFAHLRVNPARKACALLPWIALKSAMKEIPL